MTKNPNTASHAPAHQAIERLLEIMRRLRSPENGCPWDVKQDFASIAPYTIEEAYEVAEAIALSDYDDLRDELGDLLFQVVFHAQMAAEAGLFTFGDVVEAIAGKMQRRHPHVFGAAEARDAAAQTKAWEEQKAHERASKSKNGAPSVLEGVAMGLPALTRAVKLQNRAARVGFDWPDTAMVIDKIHEEMAELAEELVARHKNSAQNDARIMDEFGDLLFVYANLARHLKVDPEEALRHANRKFERRFRAIESRLALAGKSPKACRLDELEALWQEVKAAEKQPS